MSDHHPDAKAVLTTAAQNIAYEGHHVTTGDLLDALSAAGLAVVKVGDVPPWMDPGNCFDCGCAWHDNDRPLYVVRRDGP